MPPHGATRVLVVLLCCAGLLLAGACRRGVGPRALEPPHADTLSMHDAEPYLSDIWIRIGRAHVISIADLPPPRQAVLRAALVHAARAADDDGRWVDPLPPLTAPSGTPRALFAPLDVAGLALPGLRLLGARRPAASDAAPRLSVQRYWRRRDGVGLSLREDALTPRLAAPLVRELYNVAVAGAPAQLLVQRTPGGRARTLLRWNGTRARFTLRVDDDVDHPAQPRWDPIWLIDVARRLAARAPS